MRRTSSRSSTTAGFEGRDLPRDSGQITTLLAIPVMVGLVWLMMTLMIGLGDGTRSTTQTQTAADAAAIAAADSFKKVVEAQLGVLPADPVAAVGQLADFFDDPLGTVGGLDPELQARTFAAANDSVLESFTIRPGPRGPEYHVATRSLKPAQQTGVYTHAEATARLDFTSGVCWSVDAGRLGLPDGGGCNTSIAQLAALPALGPVQIDAVLVQ